MSDSEQSAHLEYLFDAPTALVWAIVCDTNRYDRAAGLTPGRYAWEELRPGDPSSRARVARARQLGMDSKWVEAPYEWIEGRMVRGKRIYLDAPVESGGLQLELFPEGNKTRLKGKAYVVPKTIVGRIASVVLRAQLGYALDRYAHAVEDLLRQAKGALPVDNQTVPAAVLARKFFFDVPTTALTSGKSTPVHEAAFAHRQKLFEAAPVAPEVRTRLLTHVRDRPDEELTQVRPFELATLWNLDRRAVLQGFLHAARLGIFDLRWQLNCPTCRVGAQVASSLSDVQNTAHCEACNVSFGLDFAEHVEAVFTVSEAVRPVEVATYCASSPGFRPHVFASLTVPVGGELRSSVPFPPGDYLVRSLNGRAKANFTISSQRPQNASLELSETLLDWRADSHPTDSATETKLLLQNRTDREHTVLIERAGWNADIVRGSIIATMPDFLDLFATEAPASGAELSVRALTLLFTDLTGSTALYERIGDARAFALVEQHFRGVSEAISKHQGAIIKTMGDAVMAHFTSPAQALEAAVEMVKVTQRDGGKEGLSVKIGLHEGPCLAVRANDRLDFFGTTVNVAARLQAQALPHEIVLMRTLLARSDVQSLVQQWALPSRDFVAHLKGIQADQELLALYVAPTT